MQDTKTEVKNKEVKTGRIIRIKQEQLTKHLDKVVRNTVEETLNELLDAEADRLCQASRYERTNARKDTRAGHYNRKLTTKAGEVNLKVPKLRTLPFETAIIERYRRRESSVEEALIEMYLEKCIGLMESLADFYPQAKWQRCVVHFYRNVFTVVPKAKVKDVAAMLKAIHAQEDREAAEEKTAAVIIKLKKMRLGNAARMVEQGATETLSYYDFPSQHWRSLRTNNPLERLMREIRRRTRAASG